MGSPDDGPEAPAQVLAEALARMDWTVEPEAYCLAGFPRELDPALLADLGERAQITFEPREITVLAPARALAPLLALHPDAKLEADLVWIRLDAPMGWEVVGFLALVCGRMAEAGIPLGAVCSFDHDHLFVARRYLARAGTVLDDLFPASRSRDLR